MTSLHKQKGIALFIAILILPLLLVLGVLVMSNSFLGLKMVDARVLQGESNIFLNSAANEILQRSSSAQSFASATTSSVFTYGDVSSEVELNGEINCKRRMKASGDNFKCKYIQVNFVHSFGREKESGAKWAENAMSVGIEQPIISD
jgi:type IV pilus assembly protein PilX